MTEYSSDFLGNTSQLQNRKLKDQNISLVVGGGGLGRGGEEAVTSKDVISNVALGPL